MRLGVIDIGSNAVRFQVSTVLDDQGKKSLKKYEYLRFPLRFGEDVFLTHAISDTKKAKFLKLLEALKILFELYEVEDYMICATSAMREATNGPHIVEEVFQHTGLQIEIIDGLREAALIDLALVDSIPSGHYLHIDVGGGSTELNIYQNKTKIKSASFPLGSVRILNHSVDPGVWEQIERWLSQHIDAPYGDVVSLGTGGNINKIKEMAANKSASFIPLTEIQRIQALISSHTLPERISKLRLNPDRADVILPALSIYTHIMQQVGSHTMLVPEVGLKDGMLLVLLQKNSLSKS